MSIYTGIHLRSAGHRYMALFGLALITAFVWGCAGNVSNLEPNNDVTASFQNREWMEDYRYYHYSVGIDRRTYALLGLMPPYTVESRLWRQVEDAEEFETLVSDARLAYGGEWPRGYEIVNPEGEKVGVWFSSLYGSSVRFTDDNRVVPMITLPEKFRGAGGP